MQGTSQLHCHFCCKQNHPTSNNGSSFYVIIALTTLSPTTIEPLPNGRCVNLELQKKERAINGGAMNRCSTRLLGLPITFVTSLTSIPNIHRRTCSSPRINLISIPSFQVSQNKNSCRQSAMSLSNKLSITDVDVKGKRVLIRVSFDGTRTCKTNIAYQIHPSFCLSSIIKK